MSTFNGAVGRHGDRMNWRAFFLGAAVATLLAACSDNQSATAPRQLSPTTSITPEESGSDDAGQANMNLLKGAVFAMTNQSTGNAIIAYARDSRGGLTLVGRFPTGGLGLDGTPEPLRSQGSLALAGEDPEDGGVKDGNHLLFAVNAGSNDISVLRVRDDGLSLVGKVASGGVRPTSLTARRGLLYVLNAGSGNISGFYIGKQGALTPIPGSTQPITGGTSADPTEVSFNPDGHLLVVTGKTLNNIDTYVIGRDGRAGPPHSNQSRGSAPFGFAFDNQSHFVVGEVLSGGVSSYVVDRSGSVAAIDGPVPDFQLSPGWVLVTENGRFVYAVNIGNRSISSYELRPDGQLTLLEPIAAFTDAGGLPLDPALTKGSRFLYVINDVLGTIDGFRVGAKGDLTQVSQTGGLPPNAQGLAAR